MKKSWMEHPFFEVMGAFGDLIVLNMVFVLSALPILGIGISLTALYRVTLRMARGECVYPLREFWQTYKREWKRGLVLGLLFLLSGGLLMFDVLYIQHMWQGMYIGVGILLLLWAFIFAYAFPLQARVENGLRETLSNALLLSVKYLPCTILMVFVNLIPGFCFMAGTFALSLGLPLYLLFGFALTARVNSILLNKILKIFEKEKQEDEDTGKS